MAGEVERDDSRTIFHWKVKFSSLGDWTSSNCFSPEFRFGGRSLRLCLFPNSGNGNRLEGYLVLKLYLWDTEPAIDVRYSVGIRTAKGGTEVRASGTKTFGYNGCFACDAVIERSELFHRRKELLPQDTLTFTVTLELQDGSFEKVLKDAAVHATVERNVTDASVQATVERNVADVSVQATVDRNVADVSVQTAVEESEACCGKGEPSERTGPEKILEDVGKLWPNGDHTDVLLKVRDVEFKAHRTILAARTPVLCAMFHHDTTEKASGEVSIDDCEPEVFEQLLHYVYKGAPRELSAENASALYVVAAKYLVSELQGLCVRCIRDTLCLDTFCDSLTLSLMYREDELLETATDFLSRNMIDIMESVQWQRFLREHLTWGNEIQIRAMKLMQARYEEEKRARLDQSML